MSHLRMVFLVALGFSVLLWVATWWQTGPLEVMMRQSNPPSALTFSPTGHLFTINGNSGLTDPIRDPQAATFAISPDGQRLVTGGRDGVARVWDAASGRLLHTLAHAPPGARIGSLEVASVDVLAFSPDSQLLATATGDRKAVRVWQVADGQLLYAIPYATASLAFSPDGADLILGNDPVRIFRVRDGREVRQIVADGQITLSPNGQLLAVINQYSKEGLRIFRYQDGALLQSFPGAHGYSYLAAFSPDSQYLATEYLGGGSPGWNIPLDFGIRVPIELWRTQDWRKVQTFNGHAKGAYILTFSPDGRQLATAGSDYTVKLWPVAPRDPLWFLVGPGSVLAVLVAGVAWWVWSWRY